MDRPGLHTLGLRFTVNSVFHSAPRLPPMPTNCASRRDQGNTRAAAAPVFPWTLFPHPWFWTQMPALDFANGATHQHQPLRHVEQLRRFHGGSDETTNPENNLTATRSLGYWNRQLPLYGEAQAITMLLGCVDSVWSCGSDRVLPRQGWRFPFFSIY